MRIAYIHGCHEATMETSDSLTLLVRLFWSSWSYLGCGDGESVGHADACQRVALQTTAKPFVAHDLAPNIPLTSKKGRRDDSRHPRLLVGNKRRDDSIRAPTRPSKPVFQFAFSFLLNARGDARANVQRQQERNVKGARR